MAVMEEEESSSSSSSSRGSGSSCGIHYLAKSALRSTVVLQVLQGHFRSPISNDVVFGKETSIELVIIDEDGFAQSICEQPVFGTIKDIAVIPWNKSFHAASPQIEGKDLLVAISDSGKLSFLTFSNDMHRFFPLTHVQLSDPGNSRYQVGRMLAVDSSGRFIAVSAYEDQVGMFSVSMPAEGDIIDKKILYPSESNGDASPDGGHISICGTIWSMCFISRDFTDPCKEQNPLLAILLNRRGSFMNELLLLEWRTREAYVHIRCQYAEAGPLAHNVVEVPHAHGFAFLFRVGDALLMDLRDAQNPCCVYRMGLNCLPTIAGEHNSVEESCRVVHDPDEDGMFNVAASALLELCDLIKDDDPMSIDEDYGYFHSASKHVCSWSWEPDNKQNPRLIFCVDSGDFFMVEISHDAGGLKVDLSDCIYKGLPCKQLLWVEGGFLLAIMEMGDGVVFKLEDGRPWYRSSIQNIAPILDMSVVDYIDEIHDQMFACCGMAPEGSLRIIRNGISVEKLLRTASIYQGITGVWTLKMEVDDIYHSFLVLSFVEQTRVLSVGLSFTDVTDMVGFQQDVSTLACGLLGDGLLVQISQNGVKICFPTVSAHPKGVSSPSPIHTSWSPGNISISLGAIEQNMIVVATSSPSFLFILGVRYVSAHHCEVQVMQHVRLQNELSCISIPHYHLDKKPSTGSSNSTDNRQKDSSLHGVNFGNAIVIGTHKPSVEILSFQPDGSLRVLAVGNISITNTVGTVIGGCVPQDVRLVHVDRLYVLSGLRNGMLLRFEWPSNYSSSVNLGASLLKCAFEKSRDNSVHLQLIAVRRIGITPTFLIPLSDSLDANIIALSDRPWLLQTARHSLSYVSISFQPSTHVTPVSSAECPRGVLFVADNSLNLVEMVQTKRLNVQKFHLGGTPRKVLYHSESRLLVVMRTELAYDTSTSDICCVDPLSGMVLSTFKLDPGETGKSMALVRVGNEQVLVVGTSLSSGPAIMPSGEAESTKGRLIVLCLEHMQNSDTASMTFCSKAGSSSRRASPFRETVGYAAEQLSCSSLCSSPDDNNFEGIKVEEKDMWQLRLAYSTIWPGMVLAVCPYLDRYILASAGNAFYVCGFPNDNCQRVRRLAVGRTRFMIMTLTAHFTRIAVGDCRDGILFYTYHEDSRKLEQLYCDPVQRLVADCILMDEKTAVVSDRKGSITVLSCSNQLEDSTSPECNLTRSCSFYMGEIAMSLTKGSFSYKLPMDDILRSWDVNNSIVDLSQNSIIASTLLGSIFVFIPLSREEYKLLEAVQAKLVVHPLTEPILGNDHNEFRSRESSAGVPRILDGDMLAQFLELTSMQQELVLSLPLASPDTVVLSPKPSTPPPVTVNQVVRLLERVHNALN